MLKNIAIAALLTVALAPLAQAETFSGKVQSIDADNNRVTLEASDGKPGTYVYAPGTLDTAKLSPGSEVLVTPVKTMTGTVVDTFRNYVRVRPDVATPEHSAEFVAIPPAPQKYKVGDRVLILSRCKIVKTTEDVVGYLLPGDIVPDVKLAAIDYAAPQPVVIERSTGQQVVTPLPATVVTPVRALW